MQERDARMCMSVYLYAGYHYVLKSNTYFISSLLVSSKNGRSIGCMGKSFISHSIRGRNRGFIQGRHLKMQNVKTKTSGKPEIACGCLSAYPAYFSLN